jgi:hypothetical protein
VSRNILNRRRFPCNNHDCSSAPSAPAVTLCSLYLDSRARSV